MTFRHALIIAGVSLLFAGIPDLAFASESMRCGKYIISAGQRYGPTQYEVLKKCGEPASRSGNTWIYEQSGGAARAAVFDYAGKLMRIERLSPAR